jgi:transposase
MLHTVENGMDIDQAARMHEVHRAAVYRHLAATSATGDATGSPSRARIAVTST